MSETKLQNIMYVILAIGVLYTVYKNVEFDDYLKDNYEFTTGKATKYSGTGGLDRNVAYKYYVNNNVYIGAVKRDYEMASPLNKYYKVKYSTVKPEVSEMYLTEEITDSSEIVKAGFKLKN
jgi:hypothetical protein